MDAEEDSPVHNDYNDPPLILQNRSPEGIIRSHDEIDDIFLRVPKDCDSSNQSSDNGSRESPKSFVLVDSVPAKKFYDRCDNRTKDFLNKHVNGILHLEKLSIFANMISAKGPLSHRQLAFAVTSLFELKQCWKFDFKDSTLVISFWNEMQFWQKCTGDLAVSKAYIPKFLRHKFIPMGMTRKRQLPSIRMGCQNPSLLRKIPSVVKLYAKNKTNGRRRTLKSKSAAEKRLEELRLKKSKILADLKDMVLNLPSSSMLWKQYNIKNAQDLAELVYNSVFPSKCGRTKCTHKFLEVHGQHYE